MSASVGSAQVSVNLDLQSLRRDAASARETIQRVAATDANVNLRVNVAGRRDVEQLRSLVQQVSTTAGSAQIRVSVSGREELNQVRRLADSLGNDRIRIDVDVTPARNRLTAFRENISNEIRSGLVKGLTGVGSIEQLGAGIGQRIGSGISGALTNAVSSVASQTVNIIGSSLSASKGFSGSIRSFAALSNTGIDSTEVKEVRQEIEKLAIATTKTPPEIASAAIELTKLGFNAKEVKRDLGGLVQLGEATGTTLAKSASIIGATTNVFQRSSKEIADVVAATANATAADANDFLQAVSKAGGVAKANNQDLETLAITFGLIRNAGFEAETAATAVKTAINRLSAPTTKKAKDAITELGVQIRDGTTKEMRNLVELIPEFRAALSKLAPDKKAQLVRTIFGDEGGPAFLALMSTSQEKIDSVSKTIRNAGGIAAETSEKLIGGLSGALTRFTGSFSLLQIKFGDALAPAAEAVVNFAGKVLNNLLETKGEFGEIKSAAQAFGDELSNNEELAKSVQEALGLAIEELATQGITVIQDFTQTLKENPRLLAEMVTTFGQFIQLLGKGVELSVKLANKLGAAGEELRILTGVGGAEGEGARQAIKNAGGTRADIDKFNKDFQEIQKSDKYDGSEKSFNKAIESASNPILDAVIKRNQAAARQKKDEEVAAQSDAARKPSLIAAGKALTAKPDAKPVVAQKEEPDKKELLKKAKEEKQKALKNETLTQAKAESEIKTGERSSIIKVKQSQLSGKIDSEQAQTSIEAVKNASLAKEIQAASNQIQRLKALKGKGVIDSNKFAQDEIAINDRIQNLKLQQVEAEIKAKENANRTILQNLERANKQAEIAITQSANSRILAARRSVSDGKLSEEQAAAEILKIKQDATNKEIGLILKKIADTEQLSKRGVITEKEATDKKLELQIQLASKNQEIVEQEIENQKRLRDESIKAIEDRISAEKRRSDLTIAGIEAEKQRLVELTTKQDEITRSLVESRAKLASSLSNADQSKSQIKIDQTGRALEIRRRLDTEKDIAPGTRQALQDELKSLSFSANASELDILNRKQQLEDQLASKKLKALEAEQQLARNLEELEIRRIDFAQRAAYYEAQIALAKAKQVELEARGQLQKANLLAPGRERNEAIANATNQIQLAQEGVGLAKENLNLANEQSATFKELADNKRAALKAEQDSEKEKFQATELSRNNAQNLELAEAKTRNIQANGAVFNNSKAIPIKDQIQLQPANFSDNQGKVGELLNNLNNESKTKNSNQANKPKEELLGFKDLANDVRSTLNTQQDTVTDQFQASKLFKKNSIKDQIQLQPQNFSADQGKIGELLNNLKESDAAKPGDQLKSDETAIVSEIQKLNQNIQAIASRPTNLQVSSPDPISDAAKIYNDINRNAVKSSGL